MKPRTRIELSPAAHVHQTMKKAIYAILALVIFGALVFHLIFQSPGGDSRKPENISEPAEARGANVHQSEMAVASRVSADSNIHEKSATAESGEFKENTIYGKVIDEAGAPLSKWIVQYYVSQNRIASAVTDAKGEFTIEHCAPAAFKLQIMEPRVRSRRMAAEVSRAAPAKERILIKIADADRASCEITGIVHSADGLPAAGALIEVFDSPSFSFNTKTDAEGKFIVSPLCAGKYKIRISHPRHAKYPIDWKELLPKESWNIGTVTLNEGGRIIITLSGADENMLKGSTIQLFGSDPSSGKIDPSLVIPLTLKGVTASSEQIDGGVYYIYASSYAASLAAPIQKVVVPSVGETSAGVLLNKAQRVTFEYEMKKINPAVGDNYSLQILDSAGAPVFVYSRDLPVGAIPQSFVTLLSAGRYRYEIASGGKVVAGVDFEVESSEQTVKIKL